MTIPGSHSPLAAGAHLFGARQCVTCDGEAPTCNCAADENCVLVQRTCSQCPTIQCNKKPSSGGGGVNPGVIAGPVVAILVIASLCLFWYLRRKKRRDLARLEELAARARKAESAGFHLSQPGSPVPGSARTARSAGSGSRFSRQSAPGPDARSPTQPQSAFSPTAAAPLPSAGAGATITHRGPHEAVIRTPWRRSAGQARPPPPMPPPGLKLASEHTEDNGDIVRVYTKKGYVNFGAGANTDGNGNAGANPFSDDHSSTGSDSWKPLPVTWLPTQADPREAMRGNTSSKAQSDHAAKTLNEARENLFKGNNNGAPQRPARSPGLDLRLNSASHQEGPDPGLDPDMLSANHIRDSYLSGNSGAPSFSSGYTSDLHTDAPKIFTSKHVQMGRFQQAEVVQFGNKSSAPGMEVLGQNSKLSPAMVALPPSVSATGASSPTSANASGRVSPSLSAVRSPYADPSHAGFRNLTPTSSRYHGYNDLGDAAEEMPVPELVPPGVSPTDLRFSMGSLAYRDSVSSMGTERYLARPDSSAYPLTSYSSSGPTAPGGSGGIPPPRAPFAGSGSGGVRGQERESVMSGRSEADSVLSAFPMIPPGERSGSMSNLSTSTFPQSSSAATLAGQLHQRPDIHPSIVTSTRGESSRPPISFRAPSHPSGVSSDDDHSSVPYAGGKSRPQTTASVADSFLGSFPFVPPAQTTAAGGLAGTVSPDQARGQGVPETAALYSTSIPPQVSGARIRTHTAGSGSESGSSGGGGGGGGGGAVGAAAGVRTARNTAMSGVSEGLGEFKFRFEGGEEVPPVPTRR